MKEYKRQGNESVTEEDLDRIAEKLDTEQHLWGKIEDEQSFYEAFENYLGNTSINIKKNRTRAYNKYISTPSIKPSRRERVAKNSRKAKLLGSRLKKESVPSKRIIRQKGKRKKVYEYKYLAKQKNKTVYARRIKTKRGYAYVTRKGYRAKLIK